MFCGVIGAGCFALAAMGILMAGQVSVAHMSVNGAGAPNGAKPGATYAMANARAAR